MPTQTPSELVVAPPRSGAGWWAGAPSVVAADGWIYLAYRLRRPVGNGRGFQNVIARSRDGVRFEPIVAVERESFQAESLERPCLIQPPGGGWRLYVSCATPETKHWRVDVLEADRIENLPSAVSRTVLPGDARHAVKDPVVLHDGAGWHLWASVHPLDRWDDADRMTTHYATSKDGNEWDWHGMVLAGRAGRWDERGARITAVLPHGDHVVATYDGRADKKQNWEEFTGVATAPRRDGRVGRFTAIDTAPLRSLSGGGLRYLAALPRADGIVRWYYEVTRRDGAHELRTEVVSVEPSTLA